MLQTFSGSVGRRRFEWSNALMVTLATQALSIDCKQAADRVRLEDLRVLNASSPA
jgi:hypothetical protein